MKKDNGPRVANAHEEGQTVSVVALAGGWVPVSSAEAIASDYEQRAQKLQANSAKAVSPEIRYRLEAAADTLWAEAEKIRRQIERATVRQPAPNDPGQPHEK